MSTPPDFDATTVPWRPTTDDVAALLRARTKNPSGNEQGTFDDQTRPTELEVERLITNGVAKVLAAIGVWDLPPEAQDEARHLASILAACEVELSYFPEQVRSDRSAYAQLWELYQHNIDVFADYVAGLVPAATRSHQGSLYTPSSTVAYAYSMGLGGWPMSDVVNVGLGGNAKR